MTQPQPRTVVPPPGHTVADIEQAINLCHVVGLLALPAAGVAILPKVPSGGEPVTGRLILHTGPGPAGGAQCDTLLPDGTHLYWSTHCRHGNHDACDADTIGGPMGVPRRPAQCMTCGAACQCQHHYQGAG